MSFLDWAELAVLSAKLDNLQRRKDRRGTATPIEIRQLQQEIAEIAAEREQILGRLFDAVPEAVG